MRGALAARVHERAALEILRIELERFAVLLQGHQLAGMVDDVDVRRARIDVGGGRIRWCARAVEEQTPRLVLRMPFRCANPAVAIAGAAAIFVRLHEEGVHHAVSEEWDVRALRVELGIRSNAVISAAQRVRDASYDLQIKIILAAHRLERPGRAGLASLGAPGLLIRIRHLWIGHRNTKQSLFLSFIRHYAVK